MKKLDEKQLKQLLAKMRTPVHINFIAQYILKQSVEETQEIIDALITEGQVIESEIAKKYYKVV